MSPRMAKLLKSVKLVLLRTPITNITEMEKQLKRPPRMVAVRLAINAI